MTKNAVDVPPPGRSYVAFTRPMSWWFYGGVGSVDEPSNLRIQPAADHELPLLEDFLGHYHYAECLDRQRNGEGILLVAWLHDEPVGSIYLRLGPPDEEEVRRRFPSAATVNRLEVRPDRRNEGIGGALVKAAEKRLARHGFTAVVLGVDLNNRRAHNLYARLGYMVLTTGASERTYDVLVKILSW